MSLLRLYSFVPICHLGWWASSFSTPRKVGHRPEGGLLAPSLTWETGAPVNVNKLYLHLAGGLSVSELIDRPNNSSNVDERVMRLGADSWRNMVGEGTISGLWSIMQKWNLEVLLGHISHKVNATPEGFPQDLSLQKYADK